MFAASLSRSPSAPDDLCLFQTHEDIYIRICNDKLERTETNSQDQGYDGWTRLTSQSLQDQPGSVVQIEC
jgi:hypothetical protein